MNATPLHATVVLDEYAIEAERRAQLAELIAERFAPLRATTDRPPYPKEANASLHLRKAARLAREAADEARERCAHQYQRRAS